MLYSVVLRKVSMVINFCIWNILLFKGTISTCMHVKNFMIKSYLEEVSNPNYLMKSMETDLLQPMATQFKRILDLIIDYSEGCHSCCDYIPQLKRENGNPV